MGTQARLLELMRRRAALGVRKAAAGLGGLTADQARSTDLAQRLSTLIDQTVPAGGTHHPARLRAAMALAQRLESERQMAANRAEFLSDEIDAARARLMRHQRRESMLDDKVKAARQGEAEAAEARAEAAIPPGRGRCLR